MEINDQLPPMKWHKPKIGTPENPEIIDPSQPPRQSGRFAAIMQMLSWMVGISVPALIFDWVCLWLVETGRQPGGWPAYGLLILFLPPAVLLSLAAVMTNSILIFAILLTLLGRPFPVQRPVSRIFFDRRF
jgi:hypothetical protein